MEITVEQKGLTATLAALKAEDNGKALRSQLNKDLRAAVMPAVAEARSAILAMPVKDATGGMREAIAAAIKVGVRATGKQAGVQVSLPRNKYPRGFKNAPRKFNAQGFRHPVFGTGTWVTQTGDPGWFTKSMLTSEAAARDAIIAALTAMAARIAESSRG